MSDSFTIWQLVDSAFPVGGFAHSTGLEAAIAAGEVTDGRSLFDWLQSVIWQSASFGGAFAAAAWREPDRIEHIDHLCDVRLWGGPAHRASRTQGRAVIDAAARIFGGDQLTQLCAMVAGGRIGHHAPVHGAVTRALQFDERDSARLWVFGALRGAVSAAVRLGVIGPIAAQRAQHQLSATMDAALAAFADTTIEDVAVVSPVMDILAASHDRLDVRLFAS